jgi:hypothetical protein
VPFSLLKVLVYLSYRRATTKVDAKRGVALVPMTIGAVGLAEAARQGFEKKS